jgi:hypothetical protein
LESLTACLTNPAWQATRCAVLEIVMKPAGDFNSRILLTIFCIDSELRVQAEGFADFPVGKTFSTVLQDVSLQNIANRNKLQNAAFWCV